MFTLFDKFFGMRGTLLQIPKDFDKFLSNRCRQTPALRDSILGGGFTVGTCLGNEQTHLAWPLWPRLRAGKVDFDYYCNDLQRMAMMIIIIFYPGIAIALLGETRSRFFTADCHKRNYYCLLSKKDKAASHLAQIIAASVAHTLAHTQNINLLFNTIVRPK